eukprot:2057538-Pyramimonas_sp.AAC.1
MYRTHDSEYFLGTWKILRIIFRHVVRTVCVSATFSAQVEHAYKADGVTTESKSFNRDAKGHFFEHNTLLYLAKARQAAFIMFVSSAA